MAQMLVLIPDLLPNRFSWSNLKMATEPGHKKKNTLPILEKKRPTRVQLREDNCGKCNCEPKAAETNVKMGLTWWLGPTLISPWVLFSRLKKNTWINVRMILNTKWLYRICLLTQQHHNITKHYNWVARRRPWWMENDASYQGSFV